MRRLYKVILDKDITYGIFKHWGCVLQVVSQVSIGFLFGFHCNDDLLHNMRVKKQHNYEGCHVRIVKGHQVTGIVDRVWMRGWIVLKVFNANSMITL